jgi:hypothetical protein
MFGHAVSLHQKKFPGRPRCGEWGPSSWRTLPAAALAAKEVGHAGRHANVRPVVSDSASSLEGEGRIHLSERQNTPRELGLMLQPAPGTSGAASREGRRRSRGIRIKGLFAGPRNAKLLRISLGLLNVVE